MDVNAFRTTREEFDKGKPFSDPDKYLMLLDTFRDSAAPEHVGKNIGTGMCDQVKCCCGWESVDYFDGSEYAWGNWREHVAEEMGLNPKECPCGETYLPVDGGVPCHELRSTGVEA